MATPQGQSLQDPLIQQVAAQNEKVVPAKFRQGYLATVAAGKKLMFSGQTNKFIQEGANQLTGGPEDVAVLVRLCMKMLGTLWQASKEQMPLESAWYALMTLSLHGIDFYDRIGKVVVTKDLLDQFASELSHAFLKFMNIDEPQIAAAIQRGKQEILSMTPEQRAAAEKGEA